MAAFRQNHHTSNNLANRPVQVSLEAMNPAVPGDAESSAIPIALFRFTVQNGGDKPVEVSLMEAQQNFSKIVMLSRSVVLPS